MGTWALIRKGGIENTIIADAAFIEAHGAALTGDGGEWVELTEGAHVNGQRPGPGWRVSTVKGARRFARPAGA